MNPTESRPTLSGTPTLDAGPASTPSSPATSPRTFGDYDLLEILAEGGMGIVWKARQRSLNRTVALKMIRAGQFASSSDVQRFRAEAEAAALLDHPNIVPIYDVGEQEGQHYFSMRLIEGKSLQQDLAADGSLHKDPRAIAQLLAVVARAVHHAHQQGILHRDLKPGNIMLDGQRQPHVTDFGLAKRVGPGDTHVAPTRITQSGAIVGTPSYMAPEQAGGEKRVTTAVDVYGLGAILYELLAGRPPFRADSPLETVLQVLERDPEPPRKLRSAVDRDLETISLKCLEKQPHRRYQSALSLAEDLERWLGGEPIEARPSTVWERTLKWVRRRPALAALVAVCLLTALGLLITGFVVDARLQTAWREAAQANMDAQQARIDANRDRQEAKNLNERVMEQQANLRKANRQAAQRLAQLTVTSGVQHMDRHELPEALALFTDALQSDQGTDDRMKAHRVRIAGMLERFPRLLHVLDHDGAVMVVRFSADGTRLLTAGGDANWQKGACVIWDATTGRPLGSPIPHDGPVLDAAFSPDGRHILTMCETQTDPKKGIIQLWDAQTRRPVRDPIRFNSAGRTVVDHVLFSPDGSQYLATWGGSKTLDIRETGTGRTVHTLVHPYAVNQAAFHVDGKLLLTACGRPATPGNEEIQDAKGQGTVWILGTDKKATYEHGANLTCAAFCSDQKEIALGGEDGSVIFGQSTDYAKGLSSTSVMRHGAPVIQLRYSPDGRQLVSAGGNFVRVWDVADWDAAVAEPLKHTGGVFGTDYSPDGCMVLSAGADHTSRAWDPFTGRPLLPPLRHAEAVRSAAFSPDGHHFATASWDHTVRIWDVVPTPPSIPPLLHDASVERACFSADGVRVVTASSDHTARIWNVADGQPAAPPLRHSGIVHSAVFSKDGRFIRTTHSQAKLEKFWDASSGQTLTEIPPETTWLVDGVLSGPYSLLRAENDARVHELGPAAPAEKHPELLPRLQNTSMFEGLTGQAITPALVHGGTIPFLTVDSNGRWLVTASADKTARLWRLSPDSRPISEIVQLTRTLTAFEPDNSGNLIPMKREDWRAALEQARAAHPPEFAAPSSKDLSSWHRAMAIGNILKSNWFAIRWHLDRLLTLHPEDPFAHAWRGRARYELGNQDEALADLNWAGVLKADDPEVWLTRGRLHFDKEEWNEAIADFDHALLAGTLDVATVYKQRGSAYLHVNAWQAAIDDLTWVLGKEDRAAYRQQRGTAYAERGLWAKAEADFERPKNGTDTDTMWMYRALLRLRAGDLAGYRKVCAAMVNRFASNLTPEYEGGDAAAIAYDVAWTCSLTAGALDDRAGPMRWAQKSVSKQADNAGYLTVLARTQYRAEQWKEALANLQKALQLPEVKVTPQQQLLLAMLHQRLGHAAEAHDWLVKAVQAREADKSLSWDNRLEFELLRKEADQLIGPMKPAKK